MIIHFKTYFMSLSGVLFWVLLSALCHADPLVVAHRGASAEAPENTLPAFHLAWKQGADAIEADFRLSKDGHIVCIHDADTKKVSGKKLHVHASSLKDLRALDVGSHRGGQFKGTQIPTFEEVLATIPEGKMIYIEIKCGIEIMPALKKKLKKSGLSDEQVVFISFKKEVVAAVKKHLPGSKAYWLYSFKRKKPQLDSIITSLRQMDADGMSSNTAIPKHFIDGLREAGYEWHVWTINQKAEAREMKRLGVKSITTDWPGLLIGD